MEFINKGFSKEEIEKLRNRLKKEEHNFVYDDKEDISSEYAHFYFIGKHEGKEVIFDAVIYTLRLHHNSELYEIAEHKAAIKFPEFKKITYDEDENGDLERLDDLEEKIGLYMAEIIMEMEAEESVKVQEHVDFDKNIDFGIGLDVGLNVEEINPDIIDAFIKSFNEGDINLDETLYSFQEEDIEFMN